MRPRRDGRGGIWGTGTLASEIGLLAAGLRLGARLFQRRWRAGGSGAAGGAGVILRFERVRPRRAEPLPAAASRARSRPQFLDRRDPRAAALEIRLRLDGRGLPRGRSRRARRRRFASLTFDGGSQGSCIASAYPVLSQPWRAVHGLPADRVSGRPRRSLVARAGAGDRARRPHQPGDRSAASGISTAQRWTRNISSTIFSASWMRTLAAGGSFGRDQRSLQALFGRPCGAVARALDGLGRCDAARGRSAGDDRQRHGELSRAGEPERRRRAARDRRWAAPSPRPRSAAMSGISPIRSATAQSFAGSMS